MAVVPRINLLGLIFVRRTYRYKKDALSGGGSVIRSTFLITTVTLTVTLANWSTSETKKPQHLQEFHRYYMAVG